MPNKQFLEESNLYEKFHGRITNRFEPYKFPTVNLFCETCNSEQTFAIREYISTSGFVNAANPVSKGEVFTLHYLCAGCKKFVRVFSLKVSDNLDYIMKVGQYPGIDISIDKDIKKSLGKHIDLFRKGLICETQGYGIGAYSYYRRIVELIIDELLDDISELLDGDDRDKYLEALQKTKDLQNTSDKIALVKDLLPSVLNANGLNPLGALYKILSEGIHNKSDEECIKIANSVRIILIFLVKQIIRSKTEKKEFTENMKTLLEKKS